MALVICEVDTGLRDSEANVGVQDVNGRQQYLRVDKHFVKIKEGRAYLPIGIVYRDSESGRALIELPHEADSGVNRLWVALGDIYQSEEQPHGSIGQGV